MEFGADGRVTKPLEFAPLTARIRAFAGRGGQPQSVTIEVGDLRSDPESRQDLRGDEELEVSSKKISLTRPNMEHPGFVLVRTLVIKRVSEFEYNGQSMVVDRYGGFPRPKIDGLFGREDHQTVRGVGISWKALSF